MWFTASNFNEWITEQVLKEKADLERSGAGRNTGAIDYAALATNRILRRMVEQGIAQATETVARDVLSRMGEALQ